MQPKPVESAVSDESLIAKRYKVLTKIGEGGVGQVLKCYDSVLHNIVAVKMLHSHASDYEMARFHREAKATAKLDHANIVKILDFGQTDEGRPFLVMEFVDGKSIADLLLERGPLATETMLPIFRQVCAGLQYAHENGVLHRDVKPSNVILSESGKEQSVKICDFGIAKLQSDDQSISHQGAAIGSPPYISPEGVRDGDRVDARSDVYSMGCLIFETLTGKVPFSGDTVVSMMMARLEKPAPKLADKSLKDFPDVVEELVATSLSLKPDDRFQNMFEMEEALADAERELAEFEKEKTSEMGAGLSAGYPIRARKRRLRFSPVLALVSLGAIAFGTILVSRISEQEERIAALETIGQSKDTKPAITHDDLETGQVITRLKDDGRLWTSVYGLCTDDELYKIPHRERITNLKMVGDDLTTDNCKALLDMPLKGVDFKDSHINDRTLEMLGRINSLDFLRLERANGFTDAGIAFLQNCPSLVAIDLRSTGITDNTIAVIAGIKPLKRLDMERCSLIRGSNIEALKTLPDLNELKLSESGFLSANLGKLRDLQELRTLVLHKSGITDQDVDSLLPLKLSKLEITHAKITDEGLLKLAQMKTLHELNVGSCKNITAAGVEKFRKLAPKCEIESD